jgi:glycosyltransferase involved in cell wall biosynthesis
MISKQLASSANISVLGEISSNTVQELFSRSKYLLMLSRYDNWPNVIFEALSQGCNVFAPPVGGIRTIAGRFIGVNLIQDPDNSECVAEFITSVDLVAPKKVIEQYNAVARTWDQVAAEILNISGVNSGTSDLPTSTVEPT